MGVITSLVRRGNTSITIEKSRQASPARLPEGAVAAAYTWDGRVPVQNAKIYKHWARTSEWVRGAIIIRKSQVSSAEWDIGPYDQTKPWSKRQALAIKKLFKTPNPANDSYRTFIEPVTEDLLTLDAGCIEKVRTLSGELVELWPVNAEHVRVNALWEGDPRVARYFWYPDGFKETARWRNEDFIYMMANPRTDTPVGLPPLETLRNAVEAEIAAHEYNRRQVENAAPDGIINLGEGFTEPQVNRFREFFESEVAGRGPLGFIGGSKSPSFIKFRDSNRDQQFLEWQVYLVRKIAVVFGLTPQDLGITFDINRSTAETQIQISEDRGLRPLMSLIQEFLTEEIVWDPSFGGMENNLAFRFTALNLKESTAKAAIYEKALSGIPWRFVNEARIDEGREPIPEMEGKLIMSTPQGAVDISDVPTVRELLEMQMAAKQAPPPTKSVDDIAADVARTLAPLIEKSQPSMDLAAIIETIGGIMRGHMDQNRDITQKQLETFSTVFEKRVDEPPPPLQLTPEASQFAQLADQVRSAVKDMADRQPEPPVVNVPAPIVNVETPAITVEAQDNAPFLIALQDLKEAINRQPVAAPALELVVRREVKRDEAGRIIEVIDHRGE
jgi:phage portal protein BeeE